MSRKRASRRKKIRSKELKEEKNPSKKCKEIKEDEKPSKVKKKPNCIKQAFTFAFAMMLVAGANYTDTPTSTSDNELFTDDFDDPSLREDQIEIYAGNLPKKLTRNELYELLVSTKKPKDRQYWISHGNRRYTTGLMSISQFKVPKECESGCGNPGYAWITTSREDGEAILEAQKEARFYYYDNSRPKNKRKCHFDFKPVDAELREKANRDEYFKFSPKSTDVSTDVQPREQAPARNYPTASTRICNAKHPIKYIIDPFQPSKNKTCFQNHIDGCRDKVKIKGDGNCLYRALAYILWKDQGRYAEFRRLIWSYIDNNVSLFEEVLNHERKEGEQLRDLIKRHKWTDREWGIAVVIQAFSRMVNYDIDLVSVVLIHDGRRNVTRYRNGRVLQEHELQVDDWKKVELILKDSHYELFERVKAQPPQPSYGEIQPSNDTQSQPSESSEPQTPEWNPSDDGPTGFHRRFPDYM